jgi:predicted peptidase
MEEGAVAYSEMGCLVSIPPGQRPGERWPILVFLHGSGEAAPLDLQVAMTRHGPLSASSGSAATQRFVIIAPQLTAPGGDVWNSRADQVKAIARSAADKYQGNPSQIYLTGFSYGGNGVLDVGFRQRDVWAALWPVDPNRCPVNRADRPSRAALAGEQIIILWGVGCCRSGS